MFSFSASFNIAIGCSKVTLLNNRISKNIKLILDIQIYLFMYKIISILFILFVIYFIFIHHIKILSDLFKFNNYILRGIAD